MRQTLGSVTRVGVSRKSRPLGRVCVGLIVVAAALAPAPAGAATYTTGAAETLVTPAERQALGLRWWPDGPMGVERDDLGYTFHTANGPNVARVRGTLEDPLSGAVTPTIEVEGARALEDLGYAAGGPVYRDRRSGIRLMFVHLERMPAGDPTKWYGTVGLAKSRDEGRSWRFLGEITTPNLSYVDYVANRPCAIVPSSFGQYLVRDLGGAKYFYIYGSNSVGGCRQTLGVARAPVAEVMAAAKRGTVSPWNRYYAGGWGQPGLGGLSDNIWSGERRSFAVAPNAYLGRSLLVMPRLVAPGTYALQISESEDGISWSEPQTLFSVTGELYAPTLIGRSRNPQSTGRRFYLYYTLSEDAPFGGFRWDDGVLQRRLITID